MDKHDFSDEKNKRFIAVLNKKHDIGRLMNALGHMSVGLAGSDGSDSEMCFLNYRDKDSNDHPNISKYPFIVLKTDNSNKIRKIRNEALTRGIQFTDFTTTMTVGSSEEQLDATAATKEENLEYIGICMFGKTEDLKEFTKKCSLFKI